MCVTLPLLGWVSFRYRGRVKASSRLQRTQEGVIASRIDAWAKLAVHQNLRLSLDPRALHFFDRESGEALR